MAHSKLASIILLSYNSASRINEIYEYYKSELEKKNIPFEFIIMDDGSEDDSYKIALQLEGKDKRVRSFALSKNFTSPYSMFAGLKLCKGAVAMFLADDFQRPAGNMIETYRKWEEGQKIIIGQRINRNDSGFSKWFSKLYYGIMNRFSDVNFPRHGADGFAVDREIIDILNTQISPRNTSPMIEVLRLGYDPCYLPYYREKTKVKSRWTWRKKWKLARDTFLAASSFPIRFITFLGLSFFILSVLVMIFLFFGKISGNNTLLGFPIPGWTTTVMLISFFNGLVLFSLGIVAEYILRIFDEVKGRPGFIIKKKKED